MSEGFNLTNIIEAALLQGGTRALIEEQIARSATAAGIGIPAKAEIDQCYAEIVDRWVSDAEQTHDQIYAYHVRLRKHLYQRSYSLNDFKNCLAIAADLQKIQAAHADRTQKAQEADLFSAQFGTPAESLLTDAATGAGPKRRGK